jgi:predicted ATPase
MIDSITFTNFKALRQALRVPLKPFNLIVGPNGGGKSSVGQALLSLQQPRSFQDVKSVHGRPGDGTSVVIALGGERQGIKATFSWNSRQGQELAISGPRPHVPPEVKDTVTAFLKGVRVYSFDAIAIARPVKLAPGTELAATGAGLAVVLDQLRDQAPERFEALNVELGKCLPEFDRILFDTTSEAHRSIRLRTRTGQHSIGAMNLSQGTLLTLAILTLAYLPAPPPFVCIEEPDRGIHPRLLRDIKDALYRLSYPQAVGEQRAPVQVIVTTHSPYLLDLFRDHPEEIIVAEKHALDAVLVPLAVHPKLYEILEGAHLGAVWYSGILGGVPDTK